METRCTFNELFSWLSKIGGFSEKLIRNSKIIQTTLDEKGYKQVKITLIFGKRQYLIMGYEYEDNSYLTSSLWDFTSNEADGVQTELSKGPMSVETWIKILSDIISKEMEKGYFIPMVLYPNVGGPAEEFIANAPWNQKRND